MAALEMLVALEENTEGFMLHGAGHPCERTAREGCLRFIHAGCACYLMDAC